MKKTVQRFRLGLAVGLVWAVGAVLSPATAQESSAPDRAPGASIEVSRFEATVEGNTAVLRWTTPREAKGNAFRIEHKHGTGPFEVLPFTEGDGETDAPHTYRYRATNLEPGTHVFRLRHPSPNRPGPVSDEITVEVPQSEAQGVSAIRPNPVQDRATVTVTVPETQEVRAAVYNVLGQRVVTLHDGPMTARTPTTLEIEGSTLQSGVYFLRVEGTSFSETRKFVRVR